MSGVGEAGPTIDSKTTNRQIKDKTPSSSRLSPALSSPRAPHNSASPSLPEATSTFHSARHDCILDLIFLFSATFEIQFMNTFSSSGTKKDDSRDRTVSKLAVSAVMRSTVTLNVRVRFIETQRHTSMNPYDGDSNNNEQIWSFKQECIPQSEMGLEWNGIRKKRDVPLRCVRSRRDDVLLERRIDLWHHFLGDTFLHVYRFKQTREPRAKDVMHMVCVMEMDE